jgi:DNA primase
MQPTSNIRKIFRERTNILDVIMRIDRGIEPVPGNDHWVGTCPLHKSSYPFFATFGIYLDQNRFECKTCGTTGDAYDYVVRVVGLAGDEAKRWLSKEYGIPLEQIVTEKEAIDARIDGLASSIMSQIREILTLMAISMEPRKLDDKEQYEDRLLKRLKAESGVNLGKLRKLFQEIKVKNWRYR